MTRRWLLKGLGAAPLAAVMPALASRTVIGEGLGGGQQGSLTFHPLVRHNLSPEASVRVHVYRPNWPSSLYLGRGVEAPPVLRIAPLDPSEWEMLAPGLVKLRGRT